MLCDIPHQMHYRCRCVYPIYRATKAVCTPDDKDDKEWLQYWMMGGLLFMLTTWVDDYIKKESVDTKWLGSLLFLFHWLYFPLTCGALLVYEKFTLPVLGPIVKPVQTKMNNIILSIYQVRIYCVLCDRISFAVLHEQIIYLVYFLFNPLLHRL